MSSARVRFNGIRVLVQGNVRLGLGNHGCQKEHVGHAHHFPHPGWCWVKGVTILATSPYLSSLPLCHRTLPRVDGQLCFLFISAADEDILAKGKQSIKSQALGNQNLENETLLEGDDDTLSSMDEKDLENLTGKFSGCAHTSASSGPRSI